MSRPMRFESLESRLLFDVEPCYAYEVQIAEIPGNDPLRDEQYALQRISAPDAWRVTRGSHDVVVAVLDTGVDIRHPELIDNIWRNNVEVAGDGLDNDGNGFVDDLFGWDFFANDNSPTDENGHGTHVAGTIAAIGNNRLGIIGVAPDVSILPMRFLGASGAGSLWGAIRAIDYVTQLKTQGVNIAAINASWGSQQTTPELKLAIQRAAAAGILFVAAAGNNATNLDQVPYYPASLDVPEIITVAATNSGDRLASFSNYGVRTVDISAPGVNILSTIPGGGYDSWSGTSMAAPHVTAAIALVATQYPHASALQWRHTVVSSHDNILGLNNLVAAGGRLNVHRALVPHAPPAPPAVAVFVEQNTLTVIGTDLANSVTLTSNDTEIIAAVDGIKYRFRSYEAWRIEFDGRGGDDLFVNLTDLPSLGFGGDGDDELIGGSARDRFFGGLGADQLVGNSGNDELQGDAGADDLRGNEGNDTLRGNDGADVLHSGQGDDNLFGGNGPDILTSGRGRDYIDGGTGKNEARGVSEEDRVA